MISKEVTEEWIEEKARELYVKAHRYLVPQKFYKDFIRSLVEEIKSEQE